MIIDDINFLSMLARIVAEYAAVIPPYGLGLL
jgi:hypothetical protein